MSRVSWVLRMALVIGAGALLLTAITVAVAPRMWRIANAHEETPVELPDFAELAARSYVYDSQGNEIGAFEVENSQPIAIGDVPRHVIQAFLAVEDKEFYVHHGVNIRSLFRATLSNFASDGPVQGASTITMQVVKNDYMAGFERDSRYKLLQMTYAVRLEKHKTKDEILERYLNTVFFGENSYGIAAAAETYFGKRVGDLTFVEAAFLAGLVQAPSTYDPITHPEQSRNRFNQVLRRLLSEGFMTQVDFDSATDTFVLPERVQRRAERVSKRTYYSEALRDYLLNKSDILGDTYEERYTRLYRGGLSIHTTLDPFVQARAEEARNQLPDNTLGIDAAITSLDTKTGAIRAMVGGRGFIPGQREVNLALAPSQTGSSIKLFVLAAALQAGATPEDLIDGTHPCTLPNPGDPGNPEFRITGGVSGGLDTLRNMTVRSINCAFSRLAQIVGLNRMVDTVYRMAGNPYLYRGQPAEDRVPIQPYGAFSIGANEMSTLDMASGIQTIANEGVHMQPYFVDYIDDARGERIYTHNDPGTPVLDRQVALTAIDVLKGVLTRGTARGELADLASRQPAFGKTGTQEKNWTAFFVGATPFLSTAVLVRDPDRYTPMAGIPEFANAGVDRVQGGTFPARIWGNMMDAIGLERVGLDADWEHPGPPARPPARLYLPGNECVYQVIAYEPVDTESAGTEQPLPVPSEPVDGLAGEPPAGMRLPAAAPATQPPDTQPPATQPPATQPPAPTTTTSTTPAPVETVPGTEPPPRPPPRPVLTADETGTTIPPDVLDPRAPLPSVPLDRVVQACGVTP
jgi:penicillin-binding protein 1A